MIQILPPRRDEPNPRPAEPGRISVADMDELIAAGEARPIFPEFDVGPTFYERLWWAVPQGAGELVRGYAVVSDEDQLELTAMFLRLEGSAEVAASYARERREREERLLGGEPDSDFQLRRLEQQRRKDSGRRRGWLRR